MESGEIGLRFASIAFDDYRVTAYSLDLIFGTNRGAQFRLSYQGAEDSSLVILGIIFNY